jgi:hypothetical protein
MARDHSRAIAGVDAMTQTFTVGAPSRFVTVTGWAFIVIGALATVWSGLQNATVASATPDATMSAVSSPGLTGLLTAYLPWVAGAGLGLSIATLAAAVGLLLRLEWARRVLIGVLALAIVANLLGLWIQHEVVQSVVDRTLGGAALPPQAAGVFDGFVTAARVMGGVVTVVATMALAWIAGCLMSPSVRREFA